MLTGDSLHTAIEVARQCSIVIRNKPLYTITEIQQYSNADTKEMQQCSIATTSILFEPLFDEVDANHAAATTILKVLF
jgi:magnesium-transporting ATPase (P-type)